MTLDYFARSFAPEMDQFTVAALDSAGNLSLREYPEVTYPVINVTTVYPGANAELIQGFITRPLERAIAKAEGIDYIVAHSEDGMSRISAHLQPGFAHPVLADMVQRALRQQPADAMLAVIRVHRTIQKRNAHSVTGGRRKYPAIGNHLPIG